MCRSSGLWWSPHWKPVGGKSLPQGIPLMRCQLFSLGEVSLSRLLPEAGYRGWCKLSASIPGRELELSTALPVFTFWIPSLSTPCCISISSPQDNWVSWLLQMGKGPLASKVYVLNLNESPSLAAWQMPSPSPCLGLPVFLQWTDLTSTGTNSTLTSTPSFIVTDSSTQDCSGLPKFIEIHYRWCSLSPFSYFLTEIKFT